MCTRFYDLIAFLLVISSPSTLLVSGRVEQSWVIELQEKEVLVEGVTFSERGAIEIWGYHFALNCYFHCARTRLRGGEAERGSGDLSVGLSENNIEWSARRRGRDDPKQEGKEEWETRRGSVETGQEVNTFHFILNLGLRRKSRRRRRNPNERWRLIIL